MPSRHSHHVPPIADALASPVIIATVIGAVFLWLTNTLWIVPAIGMAILEPLDRMKVPLIVVGVVAIGVGLIRISQHGARWEE